MTVADIRRDRGLTQLQLAVRAGITPTALARIESGKVDPKLSNAKKLADALGVKVDDLIADN